MAGKPCGVEDRCEWKKAYIEGHTAMVIRAEKAEAEVERLKNTREAFVWLVDTLKHHHTSRPGITAACVNALRVAAGET